MHSCRCPKCLSRAWRYVSSIPALNLKVVGQNPEKGGHEGSRNMLKDVASEGRTLGTGF